jgi:hypothetical protein
MKKVLFACLLWALVGFSQGAAAEDGGLVFHYPLYYFSQDKSTDPEKVRGLAASIEKLLASNFTETKSGQKATAEVAGAVHLGEMDVWSLEALFRGQYPAIVIAESDAAANVADVINRMKKPPMVLVFLNVKECAKIHISPDIANVISIFGAKSKYDYQLKVADANREFNVPIKGKKKAGLFAPPETASYVSNLLYSALASAIASQKT